MSLGQAGDVANLTRMARPDLFRAASREEIIKLPPELSDELTAAGAERD